MWLISSVFELYIIYFWLIKFNTYDLTYPCCHRQHHAEWRSASGHRLEEITCTTVLYPAKLINRRYDLSLPKAERQSAETYVACSWCLICKTQYCKKTLSHIIQATQHDSDITQFNVRGYYLFWCKNSALKINDSTTMIGTWIS